MKLTQQAQKAYRAGMASLVKGQQMREYAKNIECYSNKPKDELLGHLSFPLNNFSGWVDSYLSRMPRLKFVFKATKPYADRRAVERINSLVDRDRGVQFANYDQVNRGVNRFATLSGVGIYKMYSDSVNGYQNHVQASVS